MMEFELIDQSGKCRPHPPLEDISGIVENVERTRLEGKSWPLANSWLKNLDRRWL